METQTICLEGNLAETLNLNDSAMCPDGFFKGGKMQTQEYIEIPKIVKAIQITAENIGEIRQTYGASRWDDFLGMNNGNLANFGYPVGVGYIGDYIVIEDTTFKVLTADKFNQRYNPVRRTQSVLVTGVPNETPRPLDASLGTVKTRQRDAERQRTRWKGE